jgi:hypothetical protein
LKKIAIPYSSAMDKGFPEKLDRTQRLSMDQANQFLTPDEKVSLKKSSQSVRSKQ